MIISKESIKYSLRNLVHRKSRSLLTIASIFFGITTIFIFISFGAGLYFYIEEFTTTSSADKITVMPKGIGAPGLDTSFALTDDDLEVVKKTAGVYEVTGVYSKVAEIKQGDLNKYVFLIGYDPKKPLIMELGNIKINKGRNLISGDNGKVVLGYNYQIKDKIFPKPYEINDQFEVEGKKFRVLGFFDSVGNPQDDSQIYVINNEIESLYPKTNNSYSMFIARVDVKNIDNIVKDVEKRLRKSRGLEEGKEDFFVESFTDLLETYSSALDIVIGFVILIALISVLVSAVNTANTMISSVLERKKEIGVIKSIGARNSEVLKIFLFESGFLGFVAGVVGVGVGYMISYVAGKILVGWGWGFLQPYYSAWLFVGCVAFATVTGAISGVIPAVRASRINPVDALRYE